MTDYSSVEDKTVPTFVERPEGWFSTRVRSGQRDAGVTSGEAPAIEIGLVNSMPDAALRRTERQFLRLVAAGAGKLPVRVRMFQLPGLVRGETYRNYTRAAYHDIAALKASRLDGLIVTGTEPRAADLSDEPYWPAFTELVDWAQGNTLSTYWSCLAAHGAVQHLSGIRRRRLPAKLSGVYTCEVAGGHPLTAGMGDAFAVPHSRYNGLDAQEAEAAGYRILSRSDRVPVDMLVRDGRSLFVLAQGHPEYDTNSLLKEFRRDVRRYLAGERDEMPALPEGYVTPEVAEAMASFDEICRSERSPATASGLPFALAEATLVNRWQEPAAALFRNWLGCIAKRKQVAGDAGGRERGVSPV